MKRNRMSPIVRSAAGAALSALIAAAAPLGAAAQICRANGCEFCLDCNSDGSVGLADVKTTFNIFLNGSDNGGCPIIEDFQSEDKPVELGDVQHAYNQFVNTCGQEFERIEQNVSSFEVLGFGHIAAHRGTPGEGTPGGPTLVVPAAATVSAGATVGPVPIESEQSFQRLRLVIPGSDGFYEAYFPDPMNGVTLSITFGEHPPRPGFDCLFRAGDANGTLGPNATTSITIE